MSAIPGDVDTDAQPPMAIPLQHFVVGLSFLLAGGVAGVAVTVGGAGVGLAHVHLLLVGWVCLTILGAMTQFAPVWSGVALYSRRLARLQLWLVAVGLAVFAGSLPWGPSWVLAPAGAVMLAGFWTFAYNVGRTLRRARPLDVTERHFALALGWFLLVTALGFLLAVDLSWPVFSPLGVDRQGVVAAHATMAVFGAVLTTVVGALYQLATMFTRTELDDLDAAIGAAEGVAYPAGVALLAAGRLLGHAPAARIGGVLVVASLAGFGVVLARRLVETNVETGAMLRRYGVVAVSLIGWALWTTPRWLADPLARSALLGPPGAIHLLALGVIGFVVVGTLYHVVPFVVWERRYADRVGLERVPMVEDLYDRRVATADFWALTVGGVVVIAGEALAVDALVLGGGLLAVLGLAAFAGNLLGTIRRHSPQSLRAILLGGGDRTGDDERVEPGD